MQFLFFFFNFYLGTAFPPCNLLSYDVLCVPREGNSHEPSTIIGQDSHHVFRVVLTAAVYGCRNLCCRTGPHPTEGGGVATKSPVIFHILCQ